MNNRNQVATAIPLRSTVPMPRAPLDNGTTNPLPNGPPAMANPLRPIPTRYAGCRFRSRLEARWAVFFDQLDIRWEYEPQGYIVGPADNRILYLPDFHLPDLGLWLEIKPEGVGDDDPDVAKWNQFAGTVYTAWDHGRAALSIGDIPNPFTVTQDGPPKAARWYDPGIVIIGDWHYAWCACPTARHFDIQVDAHGGRICCGCPRIVDDRYHTGNHPTLLAAYAAARSARFEHGETALPPPRAS